MEFFPRVKPPCLGFPRETGRHLVLFLRQSLAQHAIAFLRNPYRARGIHSLRREVLGGARPRLQFGVPPLGALLRYLRICNKGQTQNIYAASLILSSREPIQILHHIRGCTGPSTRPSR